MEQKKTKLDIDIEQALLEDDAFKEGVNKYERMSEQAQVVAEEITAELVAQIVKTNADGDKANDFNLSTALLATAKIMIALTSYVYKEEKEFLNIIEKARTEVINTIIPAMLKPQPCGLCPECKSNKSCTNPTMNTELLQTKSLPIVSASLIEYDIWNKMMYMYTAGKENEVVKEDNSKK